MTHFKRFVSRKGMVTGLVLVLSLLLAGAASYLAAGKDSDKGYLGVNIETLSKEEKEEFGVKFGVLVIKLVKGEAAEKAGIKKYDVIQYFNDEKIRRTPDLVDAVRDCQPGTKAKIKLVRDGKEKELTVTLGKLKLKSFDFDWKDKGRKGYVVISGGAYLGVHLQELNNDLAEYFSVKKDGGALILKVEKDTPAEKAGLKGGDVIVKFNGKDISNPKDVTKILSDLEKGDKVDIEILRHKKKKTVNAELDKRAGHHRIKILKGIKDLHFEIPEFHIYTPDAEECDIIIKEKIDEKMKEKLEKVKEKMKKVKHKLHKVHEKSEDIEDI
ncbi:MAG: PDZ domain-containing protein [Candidatus Aminicenantes bacterium]|nr:MAG: PDZ domain-containing protein [Candidatus Aminicenantes bacterium]